MKKKLMMALSLVLVAALSITGTIAWLTATTNQVTNTFTVGKIAMEMDEAATNEFGVVIPGEDRRDANEYKLIPGHTYVKDPTVYIEGDSEACYVFIHVKNEIDAIEAVGDTDIETQILAKGWRTVTGQDGCYYKTQDAVAEGADRVPLVVFESFKIKDDADISSYEGKTIVINACAVQQDGLTVEKAFAACPTDFFSNAGITPPATT